MNTPPFWSWFLTNEKKLRTIHTLPENEGNQLLYWFYQHLQYYNSNIGFQLIIPTTSKELPTLSFLTYGDFEDRQPILTLIESAPKLKGWVIKASLSSLEDQYSDYFQKEYCLNGICCKPSNIKLWGLSIDPKTDLFILGIFLDFSTDKYDSDLLREVVAIILTDTLGEERFEKHIEDFCIYSKLPEDEELFELNELKQYLEDY